VASHTRPPRSETATIKNHVAHIYEKTGVATRAAAALFAIEHRLV